MSLNKPILLILFVLSVFSSAQADLFKSAAQRTTLPPEEAFQLKVTQEEGAYQLDWTIAAGYYLYRDKIKIQEHRGQVEPQFPAGVWVEDEYFGRSEVYRHSLTLSLPTVKALQGAEASKVKVDFQGCADIGVCYPPMSQTFEITSGSALNLLPASEFKLNGDVTKNSDKKSALTEWDQPTWLLILLYFIVGIGLSFTPCVLPMIPIIASIIAGEDKQDLTALKAFKLTLAYVLAMATTYAVLGVVAANVGHTLQGSLQNVWVISGVCGVFVLLALSMFGWYDLALPRGLMNKLHSLQIARSGGDYIEAVIMGVIASMVVSPCVTPALAGSLIYIVDTGQAMTGGLALFFMGLGMGVPLLAVGAFEGAVFPKSGDWMREVKIFFGLLLLFLAVWMLDRIVPGQVTLFLFSLLFVIYGFYLAQNKRIETGLVSGWSLVRRGAGVFAILLGAVYLLGAATGGDDYFSPLANLGGSQKAETKLIFHNVSNQTELETQLIKAKDAGRPVVVYFSADWCVTCRKLEKRLFTQEAVQTAFKPYDLVKVDISSYDASSRELMHNYQVYAPPVLIQLDANSQQAVKERLVGEVNAEGMLNWLD